MKNKNRRKGGKILNFSANILMVCDGVRGTSLTASLCDVHLNSWPLSTCTAQCSPHTQTPVIS